MWRLGIVDFDSSHSVEFARRFNHAGADRDQWVDGAQVVAGFAGQSLMAPERIAGYRAELESLGLTLVDDPLELLDHVDAVLVLSLSGATHLERARPFLEARIPVFVDKPFACSVADAEVMLRLAAEYGTLLMNSSGMRFAEEVLEFQSRRKDFGATLGAVTFGPAKRDEGNPGLFHYGIHAVELLFQLMSGLCESVTCTHSAGADVVTGTWSDGRLGTVRGGRSGSTAYGFVAFCEHGVQLQLVSTRFAYRNLCRAIVESLNSGVSAVSVESSLDVVRFISAALLSEQSGGAPVCLADV